MAGSRRLLPAESGSVSPSRLVWVREYEDEIKLALVSDIGILKSFPFRHWDENRSCRRDLIFDPSDSVSKERYESFLERAGVSSF